MYLSSTGTFWRCRFSVCLLVLFDCDDADTLETLALVVGLSSVGKHWALRANSFSLCIQCFRGIEENARVHIHICLLGKMKRANSCTLRWGFECISFSKFFPGRCTPTALLLGVLPQGKRKKFLFVFSWLSLLQPYTGQYTLLNFDLHGLIRITWMQ
jgi:hypothetical protein